MSISCSIGLKTFEIIKPEYDSFKLLRESSNHFFMIRV
jgi:hypothetical protein